MRSSLELLFDGACNHLLVHLLLELFSVSIYCFLSLFVLFWNFVNLLVSLLVVLFGGFFHFLKFLSAFLRAKGASRCCFLPQKFLQLLVSLEFGVEIYVRPQILFFGFLLLMRLHLFFGLSFIAFLSFIVFSIVVPPFFVSSIIVPPIIVPLVLPWVSGMASSSFSPLFFWVLPVSLPILSVSWVFRIVWVASLSFSLFFLILSFPFVAAIWRWGRMRTFSLFFFFVLLFILFAFLQIGNLLQNLLH